MPVDFEQHEPGETRVDLSEGTNAREILQFLLEYPGVGYTPAELASETDVPRGSVGPTLQRLESAGLVRHREPYWAVTEDDKIASAVAAFVGVSLADSTFDDDWYARNEEWVEDVPDLRYDEQ